MDIILDIFYEVKIYKISLKTLTISRTSEILKKNVFNHNATQPRVQNL